MSEMTQIASKHLGQQGSYAITTDTFDPSFLVPMPRKLAREEWGITGEEFVGYDVWHCHEATFLLNNGLPVAGTLKIVIPSDSEFMVESKSFKLYLNTFDMCKMGSTFEEGIQAYEKQVQKDITGIVGAPTLVKFFSHADYQVNFLSEGRDPTLHFMDLYRIIPTAELQSLDITDYSAEKVHFNIIPSESDSVVSVFTNVLRSRCRHTKQKDTGAAYFIIKTKEGEVDLQSLLKEVVALREVNEFHEFCSEKLFTAIKNHPLVTDCMVMLLYARRGSLDINPVRATDVKLIPTALINPDVYTKKAMGQ